MSILHLEENVYGHRKRLDFILEKINGFAAAHKRMPYQIDILDVGCGSGEYVTKPLAAVGYNLLGIDIDERSVNLATARNHFRNASYSQYPPYQFPDRRFDIVVCSEVIEHVDDPTRLLLGIRGCLKMDGLLILTMPNGYGWFEFEKLIYDKLAGRYVLRGMKKIYDALRRGGAARVQKDIHGIDCATPNTLKENDIHLQHFTLSSLDKHFGESALEPVAHCKSTIFSGPFSGSFLKSQRFMRFNSQLADRFPSMLTSGWYFVLRRQETPPPRKLLIFFPYFSTEQFFATRRAQEWEIHAIADFLRQRRTDALRKLRSRRYEEFAMGVTDMDNLLAGFFVKCMLLTARAPRRLFVDNAGRQRSVSWLRLLFVKTPEMLWELFIGAVSLFFAPIFLGISSLFYRGVRRKFLRRDLKECAFLRTDDFRNIGVGGSFTHTAGFCKGLIAEGWSVTCIASQNPMPQLAEVAFYAVPYPKKRNIPELPEIRYGFRFLLQSYRRLTKAPPAFLYHRHSAFHASSPVLARLLKIPLILEYNGPETWVKEKWGKLFMKRLCLWFERTALRGADAIGVVSGALVDDLVKAGIARERIVLNPNGVDIEVFHPGVDGSAVRSKHGFGQKTVVGFIGSFGAWHGVDILAQAIEPTVAHDANIHFLLIGDGALRGYVEKIIREKRLEQFVTLTGTIPHEESPRYLAACDILVSPHVPNADGTRFFGSPTKLFEYMAMGKPIIASRLEQIGDILEHGISAVLAEPGDVSELSEAIARLANDKKMCESLGAHARRVVTENHTWRHNARRILEHYESLVEND